MTAKAALALCLLEGRVLNVKNCLEIVGLSNCSREISRMIEKPFGVIVSRTRKDSKSRYGQPIFWYDFRLNFTEYNKDGINRMKTYIKDQMAKEPKQTTQQLKQYKQVELILK